MTIITGVNRALLIVGVLTIALAVAAVVFRSPEPDLVWGRRSAAAGDVVRPRAAVIINDTLYLVDFTARIQSFDLDGRHTGLTFTTPDYRIGRPSGLGVDNRGRLIVCDSHYHVCRIYDAQAREEQVLSGDFGYVSDCVQDEEGNYYVSEFGAHDRISKLDSDGKVIKRWGGSGSEPGQLLRTRALALGPDGHLYAADACNDRIQVFSREGEFIRIIGSAGSGPGQFHYPYDLAFGPDGSLYVVDHGNCRVQKFHRDGRYSASWGTPGRKPGQLADPWALAVDRKGRVHIVDTENHRVQRVKF